LINKEHELLQLQLANARVRLIEALLADCHLFSLGLELALELLDT
jgi:hypothetical protein